MYEKYVTALRLMDECAATKDAVRPDDGWPMMAYYRYSYDGKLRELHPSHPAWDVCFDFIFANFAVPDTASVEGLWKQWQLDHPEVTSTRVILWNDREESIRILRSMPPELAEQVFPVAIARYLLREMGLPLNHRLLRTFGQFHDWYGPMILAY